MTTFAELNLSPLILKAVAAEGYETPTPIQAQSIPTLLQGRDLLGIAQTGTGKTAAFALPMLELLMRDNKRPDKNSCRALILSPTRELCSQILDSFRTYGQNTKLKSTVVFGGVSLNKQIEAVRNGVDILVATPGRLVDLIDRRALTLSKVEIFVLDEVDQMLDLGFIHAIRKLTAMLPKARQNLFFSATMPKEIAGLAANLLNDPVRVEIKPAATTAERVTQSVIHVDPANKLKLLVDVLRDPQITRALVFTRTKHGADKVVKALAKENYESAAIHGNKSQANRERALAGFKAGKILALVATDIAARGIDVDGVSHVFNYDLPFVPESYVHRIGRTARAGAAGEAVAFCTPEDRGLLRDIEKTIRQQVPIREHELGLKVDPLVPNFGWNPVKEPRKSGGGRHMPKAAHNTAKKPHHRGQPPKDGREPNVGRQEAGDVMAPAQRAAPAARAAHAAPRPDNRPHSEKRAHAEPRVHAEHQVRPEGLREKRKPDERSATPRFGDQPAHHARRDGNKAKAGFGGPRRANGPAKQGVQSGSKSGNWMKSLGE